jgi:hypothetical protein
MSLVKKILLDYAEYQQLKNIEQKYQELLKKTSLSGKGLNQERSLASTVAQRDSETSLTTPIAQPIPPITSAPSELISEQSKEQTSEGPWYFLGIPKNVRT